MIHIHASWVLPIAQRPIHDGWVSIDGHRVAAVGGRRPDETGVERDLGRVAVLPGLVNAHTHLELSYLRGQVASTSDFVTWARSVLAARREQTDPRSPGILAGVQHGIGEALLSGTAVVGDITNTLVTFDPLAQSSLAARVFYELLRFVGADADRLIDQACAELDALAETDKVRAGFAAHAPYSVSPRLFKAIARAASRGSAAPRSVHLAESVEETTFVRNAGGPWRELLEELGVWDPSWVPPGSSPVQYLDELGFLDGRVLVVHGVQVSREDLGRLAARDATLVTCPRSNAHTGAGSPPVEAFYRAGVRVAVGTDSLASTPDLNLFAELAVMRALAPSVPASVLLDSATRQGARALGFESDYGAVLPGMCARLIAVDLPADVDDVEEYLVSGIEPAQVRWID